MNCEELKEYLRTFYHAFRVPVSLMEGNEICVSYTPIALEEDPCWKEMQGYYR